MKHGQTYRPHKQHQGQRGKGTQGQEPSRDMDILVLDVVGGHLDASTHEVMDSHGI